MRKGMHTDMHEDMHKLTMKEITISGTVPNTTSSQSMVADDMHKGHA